MPPSRFQSLNSRSRKRRLPPYALPLILLVLLLGFVFYLSTTDTEVPTSRIEQDVTDALPKS
jgi:hypothetical protein